MALLTLTDENAFGKVLNTIQMQFASEEISVTELITQRVHREVEEYNAKQPDYFRGLVQPVEAEKHLNGYKLRKAKTIDAEKQCYVALDQFTKNGFFIMVDDKQVTSLEQRFIVSEKTKLSFIKLTPLVGG